MLEILRTRMTELAEQRAAAIEAMQAITDTVEAEDRSALTDTEDEAFAEARTLVLDIDAQLEQVESEVADLEAIEARTAAANLRAPLQVNAGRTRANPYDLEVRADTPTGELRGRVEQALETERSLSSEQREEALALVERVDVGRQHGDRVARHILATGRPAYRSAFGKLLGGDQYGLTPEESAAVTEARAASLTTTAGGFAVPYVIDPTMISTNAGSVNPMRQLATVKQISTGTWTGVSSAGVTASWDGEAAEVSDDAPTLAAPSIDAEKAQAFVPFSIEIGEDWPGMEADIRMMFAEAKDNLEATAHFTGAGSGSNQPNGIVTALDGGASEVAPATAETFAVADIYALEEALPAKWRQRASWTANKAIYNLARQFDTTGGTDLWVRLAAAQPAELVGYPAFEASAMDSGFDATATADNFLLILGDFSQYYIVDRIGMSIELVPHLFATANNLPSGQRGLYCYWRTGGGVVNIDAFRMLNVATAA